MAERTLLAAGPLITLGFFARACVQHDVAFDFMHAYLHGARDVWAGRSPYHPSELGSVVAFVYPPLTAYVVAPFLLLPPLATEIVVSVLGTIACFGALALVGVRDRRCYILAFGSPVMFASIQAGNISVLVTLGAALVWRYRDRKLAAVGAGLLIALKLYTWPLLLFFVITRRFRGGALAVMGAAGGILLPWAVLGFAGLRSYPELLSRLAQLEPASNYALGALVAKAAPSAIAPAVTYALAALVVAWTTRRRSDAQIFCAALGLMLLLSPLVLYDYFGVLLVVLGIMKRGYGWEWFAPLLLWLVPAVGSPSIWQLVLVSAVVGTTLVSATRGSAPAVTESAGLSPNRPMADRYTSRHPLRLPRFGSRSFG